MCQDPPDFRPVIPRVFVETSHTAITNTRTGIQSVVRGLIHGLERMGCEAIPVRWSFRRGSLTPLKPQWQRNLGIAKAGNHWLPPSSLLEPKYWHTWKKARGFNYRTPLHRHPIHCNHLSNGWIILPELMEGSHARMVSDYAKTHGLRTAGIFHDAIAWRHPELVRHWSREQHADYMAAFCKLDAVISVSRQSADHLTEFAKDIEITRPRLLACNLPAEILGQERQCKPEISTTGPLKILCVSTLEPRKNHAGIIEAFLKNSPEKHDWELHFVGARYEAAPEISEMMHGVTQAHPNIFWHEGMDSTELRNFYRICDFTVFGSSVEGFGLPVLESLWFGKPCVCSNLGVMAENAADGGCLTVNVGDTAVLAQALYSMASDIELRKKLTREAVSRPLITWKDYAGNILGALEES